MYLVTGGAGFIGSNLIADLNARGHDDIVVCDWLGSDGRWENLAKRSFFDLVLPEQLENRLAASDAPKITTVLHMGAISDTTATDVLQRNYQFTKMLWTWCARHGATFIYASSAATYGDGEWGFDDRLDLAALKKLRPLNLYGWSKHIFDVYAVGGSAPAPPRWYGLKFFNVFGPNEYHKGNMRSVVCKLAPDIIAGNPARLFQSYRADVPHGGQSRDFIYISDICDVVRFFAETAPASGIYNVGTGEAQSFRELIEAAYRAVGHAPLLDYIPMPPELQSRYQYFTQASVAKLRASGYNAVFTCLDDAVSRYMRQMTSHDRYL